MNHWTAVIRSAANYYVEIIRSNNQYLRVVTIVAVQGSCCRVPFVPFSHTSQGWASGFLFALSHTHIYVPINVCLACIHTYVFKHIYNSLCPSPIEQGIYMGMEMGSGPPWDLLHPFLCVGMVECWCLTFSTEQMYVWKIINWSY